ncbi:MAG TPA: hypothetical protein PLJ00_09190 [Chitinophagales bacterium]|nr:hypothetical protein [Chitinophagales bacterium]HRG86274.1 hypothetical protein [Chitinophagales bacterium]HRH54348.1 hypothetical protein [Chitinophagales bacterium]
MYNRSPYIMLLFLLLVAASCKNNTGETNEKPQTITDTTSALDKIIESEATTPPFAETTSGNKSIINERFGFTFEIPARYTVLDKSNNGDGYFINTGDAGTDLRIYGTNIKGNEIAAELELSTCERTESYRFGNGFPGTKCFQSGDVYYYYDTPNTRVIFYVHGPKNWFQRNEAVIEMIAQSIVVGDQGF